MYNFKDKQGNINVLNKYMLAKTLGMFEYQNLPVTIPQRELELLIQRNGYAFITKVDGELYAFTGGLGGVSDVYGNPTQITIANPALNYSATLDIKKDGVLIANDDMLMGVMPLYEKHHFLMIENDINMVLYGYNSRLQKAITASDDSTRASAEKYVQKAIEGDIAIIGENAIFDGVKFVSGHAVQSTSINNMIEYNQYLKATLYNEVGLSSNFNMKRERLITAEVDQSEDSLFPFVYNMMKCRNESINAINDMFDLNIKVDFGSVWYYKNKEFVDGIVESDKNIDPEIEQNESELDVDDDGLSPDTDTDPDTEINVEETLETILEVVEDIKNVIE